MKRFETGQTHWGKLWFYRDHRGTVAEKFRLQTLYQKFCLRFHIILDIDHLLQKNHTESM